MDCCFMVLMPWARPVLIKSVGIAVIMAQAGLYVPCSSFRYSPYTRIFTRILGADNIFKGLSTFAVEMSELRAILNQADENSLVLGDELCSGTESDSALSIFTAGLEHLHAKKSTFLFATHFHEVLSIWRDQESLQTAGNAYGSNLMINRQEPSYMIANWKTVQGTVCMV